MLMLLYLLMQRLVPYSDVYVASHLFYFYEFGLSFLLAIDDIRQTYRRSGGETVRLKLDDLVGWYERELAGITSMNDFRNARLSLHIRDFRGQFARESFQCVYEFCQAELRAAFHALAPVVTAVAVPVPVTDVAAVDAPVTEEVKV